MSKKSNRSNRSVSESHTNTTAVPISHPRICLRHPTLSLSAHDHSSALASCPIPPLILLNPDDRILQLRKKTSRPEITCFARPDDSRDFNQPVFSVYDFNAAMIAVSSVVQGKTDSAVTPFGFIADRIDKIDKIDGPVETVVWYDHVVQWDSVLEQVVDPLMIYTSEQRSIIPDEPRYSPSTIPRSRRAPVAPQAVVVRIPVAAFMASHVILFTRWDFPNDRKDLIPCITYALNTFIGIPDPLAHINQAPMTSSQEEKEIEEKSITHLPSGYLDAYPTVHLPLYARVVEHVFSDALNPMNASGSARTTPSNGSSRGRTDRGRSPSRSRSRSPGRLGAGTWLAVPGEQSESSRSAILGNTDPFCKYSFIALDDERKGGLATLMVVATSEATDVVNLRLCTRQGRDAVAVRRRYRESSPSSSSSSQRSHVIQAIPNTVHNSDSIPMIIRSPSVDIS